MLTGASRRIGLAIALGADDTAAPRFAAAMVRAEGKAELVVTLVNGRAARRRRQGRGDEERAEGFASPAELPFSDAFEVRRAGR